MSEEKIQVITQNEYTGKLKEIFLVIHEDEEGNQGVLAEACVNTQGLVKNAPELTPYIKQLYLLKRYIKKYSKSFGKEIGQRLKIKKFVAVKEEEINKLETQNKDLLETISMIEKFLNSLPEGWLGKTTGDVKALNDFYCNLRKIKP